MKLIKGKKIINATEKTYRVIFKDLGYKIYEDEENGHVKQPVSEDREGINTIGIDDITKDKIIEILNEKGIKHNPKDRKEVLYKLMVDGD